MEGEAQLKRKNNDLILQLSQLETAKMVENGEMTKHLKEMHRELVAKNELQSIALHRLGITPLDFLNNLQDARDNCIRNAKPKDELEGSTLNSFAYSFLYLA